MRSGSQWVSGFGIQGQEQSSTDANTEGTRNASRSLAGGWVAGGLLLRGDPF